MYPILFLYVFICICFSGRGVFPQAEDEVTDTEYVSSGERVKYSVVTIT